jgi:hypothetical protein
MTFQLAHVNVAVAMYPQGDPRIAGFYDNIERINLLAEQSPGFIWRCTDEAVDEEARRIFVEPSLVMNLTLWESAQALSDYVYRSAHAEILRKRAEWFKPRGGPAFALWWVQAGNKPTISEARHRLNRLQQVGPTEDAFTFNSVFPPPEG